MASNFLHLALESRDLIRKGKTSVCTDPNSGGLVWTHTSYVPLLQGSLVPSQPHPAPICATVWWNKSTLCIAHGCHGFVLHNLQLATPLSILNVRPDRFGH